MILFINYNSFFGRNYHGAPLAFMLTQTFLKIGEKQPIA